MKADYNVFKRLAEARDVSAYAVGKATGLSSSLFSDWKNGKYVPKWDKIDKIAGYFGVPADMFYADSDDPDHTSDHRVDIEGAGPYMAVHEDAPSYRSIVLVQDDAMRPHLYKGDICVVEDIDDPGPDDLTVIKIDGADAVVRFVEFADSGVYVRASDSELFPDEFFSVRDVMAVPVSIVGVVTELRRRLR